MLFCLIVSDAYKQLRALSLSVCLSVCNYCCLSVIRVQESVSVNSIERSHFSLPEHVFPSPFRLYPGRHRHSCPKNVFTQICSQGPSPLLLEHSSSSEGPGIRQKDTRLRQFGDILKGQLGQ